MPNVTAARDFKYKKQQYRKGDSVPMSAHAVRIYENIGYVEAAKVKAAPAKSAPRKAATKRAPAKIAKAKNPVGEMVKDVPHLQSIVAEGIKEKRHK